MLWFNQRSNKTRKQMKKAGQLKRGLRFERLEAREVLNGTVVINLVTVAGVGNIVLTGDNGNNDIEVRQSSSAPNSYIFEGKNNTLLNFQVDGVPGGGVPVSNPFTVGSVTTGNFTVNLASGTDKFSFLGISGGGKSTITGNLVINNSDRDLNVIEDVVINGNLNVARGDNDYSELSIVRSTVNGTTTVNNNHGDTKTTIDASILQGAFSLTNGDGADINTFSGASQFGVSVTITNGAGGSMTVFTTATGVTVPAPAGPTTTTIYGTLHITNGANVLGTMDVVMVTRANIWGGVLIINDGGTTSTMFNESTLGSNNSSPPANRAVVIQNTWGFDSFAMNNSSVPWGLLIDNDVPAHTNAWGSESAISASSIGTRIGGPVLPPPAAVGDAFMLLGDHGRDLLNMSGVTVGGIANLSMLQNGNNEVNITGVSSIGSLWIVTGKDNDTVLIDNSRIADLVRIWLNDGADKVTLLNIDRATEWPNPLVGGVIDIQGGGGVFQDTINNAGIALGPGIIEFEIFVAP